MNRLRSTYLYRLIAGVMLAATAPLLAPPGLIASQAVDEAPADWLRAHYAGPRAEVFEAVLAEVEAQEHHSLDAFLMAFLKAYAAHEDIPTAHLAGFHTLSGPLSAFTFQAHLLAMVVKVVSARMGTDAVAWGNGLGDALVGVRPAQVLRPFATGLKLLNRRVDGHTALRIHILSAAQPLGP